MVKRGRVKDGKKGKSYGWISVSGGKRERVKGMVMGGKRGSINL